MDTSKPANWEIATYALYLLRGTELRVPTEDIAKKCFELAPDTFSWVKYPEYPDKDIVRSALMDARKEKHGALVAGRAGRGRGRAKPEGRNGQAEGWMLTTPGVDWIMAHKGRMALILNEREASAHRQERLQKVRQWKNHPLFREYLADPVGFNPSLVRLAEFFRCRVDADKAIWEKRTDATMNVARAVEERSLVGFVERCRIALLKLLSD